METTINANVQEIDLDDFGELSRLPAEVRKDLWIGSEVDAGNEQWLVQQGIQAVLNCTEEVVSPRRLEIYQKLNIQHLHVAMYDDPSEDLGEVLVKARPWLQQMKDERVLVRCFVGGNRSVAVVILGFARVLFPSWLTTKTSFFDWGCPQSDVQSVYVCLVSLQHLNVFKYIHIIIIVEIFIQMFLTIAPKISTSTEDLLPCPRWGRGLLGCPYKGFLCPWSGVGQWLLSIAAAAAAEADCKWPFRAREKSCCCILLPQILSGGFFATFVRHLCTFPSFSVHAIPRIQQKACTAPQKPRQAATSQPLWCRDARAQWGKLLSGWSLGCKTLR